MNKYKVGDMVRLIKNKPYPGHIKNNIYRIIGTLGDGSIVLLPATRGVHHVLNNGNNLGWFYNSWDVEPIPKRKQLEFDFMSETL